MRSSRTWMPRGPRRGSGTAVELKTSAAVRDGRAAVGIVLRSAGQTLRVAGRAVRAETRSEAAYRAVLYGLWRARGIGARHIRVFTDAPAVAAELNDAVEVPPERIGLYLQTRAMLNAWRSSSVECIRRADNAEAALAAVEALDQEPIPSELEEELSEPLPLWQSAKAVGTPLGSTED